MSVKMQIAVGILKNEKGEVLIAQRRADVALPAYWEFPGGKYEQGETGEQALARELSEEIGIEVQTVRPLLSLMPGVSEHLIDAQLSVWLVENYSGSVYGREGQPCRWVSLEALLDYQLPPASELIIEALRLC